jgi:small GTP-binding protein
METMPQTPEEIALDRIRQAAESGSKELNLSDLQLKSLPNEIWELTHLQVLMIVDNEINFLSSDIKKLTALTRLYLTRNKFTSLPQEIWNLPALKEIYISGNPLLEIPPHMWERTDWEGLGLGKLCQRSLPTNLFTLKNLRNLALWDNDLNSLPLEIYQLTNLVQIDLRNNMLTKLSPNIGQLTNIKQIDLGDNQLTELPIEIGKLINIEKLYLYSNNLTNLPAEIDQFINLKILNLSDNNFTSLPIQLWKLPSIEELLISNNPLRNIPLELWQKKGWIYLGLADLKLTVLPKEVENLTSLRKFDLYNNQLTELPLEIGNLTELTELNLWSNRLSQLPQEISKLKKLKSIELFNNRFTRLPPEIGQLTHLTQLVLWNNKLTHLPPEINQLKNLTYLDLQYNQLASLPPEISALQSLEYLSIRDNPLEIAIPPMWSKHHAQEIIAYYKQMHEEGGRPLGEGRIVVVGEADAGKTKLLRALLHGEHGTGFKDARDPTDGIEVNSSEANDIKLRYWDFGGQELYHATHRFFLSRRCVYVLVADATKDSNYNEEKIEYWLELLKFFGGDSPVILVASKVENYSLNVNERRLQEKYPNLVKMPALRTSAKTGMGIEDLRRVILEQVKSLPSVGVMLPRSFLAVKDELEEIKRNEKVKVLEDTVYRRLCEENGINEEERQNTLLALLHDMGVVLHYEDDRLSDFGILNPDWATGGVYKVVNSPQIEKSQGRFTLTELKSILADEELYPATMRRRIVDLMKKFELTFELPFERDAFILPSALPHKQPELIGWDVPCMTFEYRYPLLQVSVLHRFIVAEHDLIQDGLVWHSGVVIARGANQALVIADTRDKRITIKIKGAEESRKEFLYSIRLQFERIHGEEAKPEEYVYSPQHPELSLLFVDMKTMAKTEREYKVVHKGKMVNINLRELLDGFITSEERRKDEEREKQEDKRGDTYITNNNITMGNMEGSNLVLGEGHRVNQTVQKSFNTFPLELQTSLLELMK